MIGIIRRLLNSSNTPLNLLIDNVKAIIESVKIVVDNITNKLNTNLDVKVSTRAAANTALSNTVWTNSRASYLDRLVSGVPVNTLENKIIKSVQRGTAGPPSGNAWSAIGYVNISAVNVAKSILICSGGESARAILISNNTIEYCTYSTSKSVAWEVIEFM